MASRQQLRKLLVKLAGQADAQACQAVSSSRPGLPFRSLSLGSRLLSSNAAQSSVSHGASAVASTEAGSSLRKLIQDYKQLSKFKLSSLVVLTASAGFAAASGDAIDYEKLAWTCLGTMGAAACANTLNQIYEVANDRMMSRTRNRPLPAGRLGRLHAAVFAAVCGAAGLWVLHEKTNNLTTALGAANILLYAAIYTPLKQLTVANTWVGAVVGAIPPLMGWAAASGSLDAGAAVLAAALFFWQMPHFLALAWLCKADYAAGGFKMLSMFDATGRRTALAALRHSVYIAPIGLLAVLAGFASEPFAYEGAALAGYLVYGSAKFAIAPSQASARKLFRGSLLYLPLLLLGLAVHRVPNTHAVDAEQLAARALDAVPGVVRRELGRACAAVEGAAASLGELFVENNIKCPSKAYGDSEELHVGQGQGDQEQQQIQQQQELAVLEKQRQKQQKQQQQQRQK